MTKAPRKISMRKVVRLMPMSILRIKPGDVLVLQTDLVLDKDQITALRDAANHQFQSSPLQDFKVAILTGGLKVGVLRKR